MSSNGHDNDNIVDLITKIAKIINEQNVSHIKYSHIINVNDNITIEVSRNINIQQEKGAASSHVVVEDSTGQTPVIFTHQSPTLDRNNRDPMPHNNGVYTHVKSHTVGIVKWYEKNGKTIIPTVGMQVQEGEILLIVYAMKTNYYISAPKKGVIYKILVQIDQLVEFDEDLLILEYK